MKLNFSFLIAILMLAVLLPSCELIGDIFQAGFVTAIIVIVIIVGLVLWLVSKFRR